VAERANLVRPGRRESEDNRGERAEQSPHACLDVETPGWSRSVQYRHGRRLCRDSLGRASFPGGGSLKGKRKYVKSAKAQLQQRFGASVAEVDHHELWQRSRLTLSCVARDHRELQRLLDGAERYLAGQEFELAGVEREIVSLDDGL
jgi:uncharacterized protein YlxP (DUF503 family)